MSRYHHLTIEERECLFKLYLQNKSIREIARCLSRSPSTISRELSRTSGEYSPHKSQKAYGVRRKNSVRHKRLAQQELNQQVRFLIAYFYWSPEQVCERMRLEAGRCVVSTSTIYRSLDNGMLRDTVQYYLRRKYKKIGKTERKSRKCFEKSITLRPQQANDRTQKGHWEGDTVLGHAERTRLVTLVDRMTRYTLIGKVRNAKVETINSAIIEMLSGHDVYSITLDQGTEFASPEVLQKSLNTGVYFAHPHSPWERPTNENTNGLIRQFVPKRSSISSLTQEDVNSITARLNLRPRKCIGWRTPYEAHFDYLLHLT